MSTQKFDFFFFFPSHLSTFFFFLFECNIFFYFFFYGRVDDLTEALNEILVVESGFY